MVLKRLEIERFRNFEHETLDFSPDTNVICGENAQGKTNLLEAIYYLTGARSFRAARDAELIMKGGDTAALRADFEEKERAFSIEARLGRGVRRRFSVNRVPIKTLSELSGRVRAVLFSPEDLALVKGGGAERRRFLDLCFSQLRPRYAEMLLKYNRLREHKLRILRDGGGRADYLGMLDTFNLRMAETGAVIIGYRALFLDKLSVRASALHSEISGGREVLGLNYKTASSIEDPRAAIPALRDALAAHMEARREAEIASGSCLVGPHRDDIEILVDGYPAKQYASQGQMRTAALSLKLAERELFLGDTGEAPLLLLDDVLSELDAHRRDFVLNRIGGGQVFITLCNAEDAASYGGKTFVIRGGSVSGGVRDK